jgi:hypothetical protein
MAQDEKQDRLNEIGNVEVEPLTDADLESASGGSVVGPTNNATTGCGSNAANACC